MKPIKRVAILGCSGSIGRQTVDVIENHRELFKLAAVTVYDNTRFLESLCVAHAPSYIGIADESAAKTFSAPHYCEIASGESCNETAASLPDIDIVVVAIPGLMALQPLLAAIRANKRVAIANKEALVCAGGIISEALLRSAAELIPVDSEQSAIFQCLKALNSGYVARLILTASGGPFLRLSENDLKNVTPEMALAHPNWRMGEKITIDSATLANKGLELMEARSLFGINDVSAVIHPQSVVHSMVETVDGSILAQLSQPDMRLPIQYALTYPDRFAANVARLDLPGLSRLEFFEPDLRRFRALALAYDVLKADVCMCTVYDAANTAAVEMFRARRIAFCALPDAIEHALNCVESRTLQTVQDVFAVADEAKVRVYEFAAAKERSI